MNKTAKYVKSSRYEYILIAILVLYEITLLVDLVDLLNRVSQIDAIALIRLATLILFGVIAIIYFQYTMLAKQKMIEEIKLETILIDKMYQQFDVSDLTVFNQKYFDCEDEVLNFILTEVPKSWFMNINVEFLYDAIQEGYLYELDGLYEITKDAKIGILKVYYISNNLT